MLTKGCSYLKDLEKNSESGGLALKIGEEYLQKNEWGMALRWFKRAFSKGGVQDRRIAKKLINDCCRLMGVSPAAVSNIESHVL